MWCFLLYLKCENQLKNFNMSAKCLIYSRVSTEKQNNDSSINDLKDYANYKKYEIVEVYEDTISGKSKGEDRTGFKQLLNYIQNNEIEHILIWELSRLGRNLLDVLTNINILTELKINVYSKKENLNTLNEDKTVNPNSTLILNLMSSISEYERTTIQERIKRGFRYAVKQGAGYSPAYGYMTNNEKKLVINEVEAKTVKLIYKMFLEGINSPSISKHLNLNNIPTKKGTKWSDVQVRTILHNTLYYGERAFNFGIVKAPAIINKSQFQKVQEIFLNNRNYNKDKAIFKSYLSGLIRCGVCGLNYFQHARVTKTDFAYKCQSHRQQTTGQVEKKCGNHSIGINWLNSMVYYSLINNSLYLINSKKYKDYTTKITQFSKQELSKTNKQIIILETEIKKLTNNLNRITNFLINGTLDESDYINRKDILSTKIEQQKEQLNKLLINKEQLNQSINNSNKLKHFVNGESFQEHIKTFIQSVTINKVEVTDNTKLNEIIPKIHHNRITKVEVKTIFKEYVFYNIVGFPKHSFQLTGNNLKQITLIDSIVQ